MPRREIHNRIWFKFPMLLVLNSVMFCLPIPKTADQSHRDSRFNQISRPEEKDSSQVTPVRPLRSSFVSTDMQERRTELAEANRLNDSCLASYNAGKYDDAIGLCQRALGIRERLLGHDHLDVAQSLHNLAYAYTAKGDYPKAGPLYQRVLEIFEEVHIDERIIAISLSNIATFYQLKSEYARAEPLSQRSLALFVKAYGEHDPDVAQASNNLAELYRVKGEYDKAEPLFERALRILDKANINEHPLVGTVLNNLALVQQAKGQFGKAESHLQRSRAIREKTLGNSHPDVAQSLNNLAELHVAKGEYALVEPLYKQALGILENGLGKENRYVATVLTNLGKLYGNKGDYVQAEPQYQRALAILEKALGREHPDVAEALKGVALVYRLKGEFGKAEPLYERALAIEEKAFGYQNPSVAETLVLSGELYAAKQDFVKAEERYQRALTILENAGAMSPVAIGQALNSLGDLYRRKGEYAKAEARYARASTVLGKAVDSEHPEFNRLLNNQALLHHSKGEYAKAEPLYQRALTITEKSFGNHHPYVGISLDNLATLYVAKEDYPRALEFLSRALEVRETNINSILTSGSESQKQLYLNTLSGETTVAVSLHVNSVPANAQAARLALTSILQRKGRALDAMADQLGSLRLRASPEDVKLLDALRAAQWQLSTLQLSNDARVSPAERRKRVTDLEGQIEKLENDIGRHSAEFRARQQSITLDAVRKAIPTGSALVEIFVYEPFNPKTRPNNQQYGPARYVAYVLKSTDDVPQFVELGDAASIDGDATEFRAALQHRETSVAQIKELARKLDKRVMQPVRKLLGSTKQVFLSPDGTLNLVPFGAFLDEKGHYLVEDYSFDYLTSGRDLIRLKVASESRDAPTIIANPLFTVAKARRKTLRARDSLGSRLTVDTESRTPDFAKFYYPPLAGTEAEAKSIAALLQPAQVWVQAEATEARVKMVDRPRILHIATHGFFFPGEPKPALINGPQKLRVDDASRAMPQNPMLRSGLILAGVNQKQSGPNEDGVLTAQEAAALNLFGTKLVVLSACETGLFDVQNGDGVYGLRRALVLAGSETQVMSLWQVSDTATRDLMIAYYGRLQSGGGRVAALRDVQLAMLRGSLSKTRVQKTKWRHPYFWAAFIPSGSWLTLDGKEAKFE